MKVYDILVESSEVKEAPMGIMGKIGNKIASKVPGEIGRRASGSLESGEEANKVKQELSQFMGRSGIGRGQLSLAQLMTFMNQKGYGGEIKGIAKGIRKPGTPANAPLSNAEVDQIIRKATQTAAGAATTVKRGAFAAPVAKGGPGTFSSKRGASIPPQIASAVAGMSAQQKAALLAMLGGGGAPATS